ncbi:carbohydrate kinase family protein [Neobacillus cucumis]|uniref:Kinase n=1 Tax=Neobacillus cucumis TaxID=1740721 RepID=A0A2N5HIL6_9BACI|nr:carbohydrate kinase family protein [Neobacillus cucumis]PLS05359.1 kinase [Neobacillus cucumis]
MEKNIFVLGELNVDLIFSGEDITPEWNREKLVDHFEQVLGSSSAITACVLAGLGHSVYFVGVVGDDPFGHFCINQLNTKGVKTNFVTIDPKLKTGVTLSLSTSKDRALLTYMGAIPKLKKEYLPKGLFQMADHIHFGSYYLQQDIRQKWKEIFSEAKRSGVSTSFDTGWDPDNQWHSSDLLELLEFTDFFIPSEDELFHILNINQLSDIPENLPQKRGMVAVKRGKHGSVLFDNNGTSLHVEAFLVNPIDTTGAGDSFNAGLISGYLANKRGEELLRFANACGALATLRIGGASSVPSMEEVSLFQNSFAG